MIAKDQKPALLQKQSYKKLYKKVKKYFRNIFSKTVNFGITKQVIFLIIGFLIILSIGVFSILHLFTSTQKVSKDSKKTQASSTLDVESIIDLEMVVTNKDIKAAKTKLIKGQRYKFKIAKIDNSNCTSLTNLEYGYVIYLTKSETTYVITTPNIKSSFTFSCEGQNSKIKFSIE